MKHSEIATNVRSPESLAIFALQIAAALPGSLGAADLHPLILGQPFSDDMRISAASALAADNAAVDDPIWERLLKTQDWQLVPVVASVLRRTSGLRSLLYLAEVPAAEAAKWDAWLNGFIPRLVDSLCSELQGLNVGLPADASEKLRNADWLCARLRDPVLLADSALGDALAGFDLLTWVRISRFIPAYLHRTFLDFVKLCKLDVDLIGDETLVSPALLQSTVRLLTRWRQTLQALQKKTGEDIICHYVKYTDIDEGFVDFSKAVQGTVEEQYSHVGGPHVLEQEEDYVELIEGFSDAELRTRKKVFSFFQLVFASPREEHIAYVRLGMQHLLCLVVHKNSRFLKEYSPLLKLIDKFAEAMTVPESKTNTRDLVSFNRKSKLGQRLIGSAIKSVGACLGACIRSHPGFVFDDILLAAADHTGLPPPAEAKHMLSNIKAKPDPTDCRKLIKEMLSDLTRSIWVLDPAFAHGLLRTGSKEFRKRYRVLLVPHGIDVPVGLGFTELMLPTILRSKSSFVELRRNAFTSLWGHRDELASLGIALDASIAYEQGLLRPSNGVSEGGERSSTSVARPKRGNGKSAKMVSLD